jgi:hypothetical protein
MRLSAEERALKTLMEDQTFGLRVFGRDHQRSDAFCSGCEAIDGESYPRLHKSFGSSCPGLVHAERFVKETGEVQAVIVCDVCFANPK